MRFTRYIVTMLASVAVLFGLTTVSAYANEPVVSEPTYSESTFQAVDNVSTVAKLKSKTKGKVYLNVQAKPMTADQIQPGSCVTKPVGTWFWNEIIDAITGEHKFDHRQVQAGDNVFCKDRSGVLRKKSCGNEAIFAHAPPKRLRVKGKVKTADYIMWVAEQTQKITKTGSAIASVKTETCEARATVDNTVFINQLYRVRVKSRTMSEAQAEGSRQITIQAKNDQVVEGKLKTDIKIGIYGKATALCKTPPPEHDECPSIPGNQPPGYVCESTPPPPPPPATPKPIFIGMDVINDVLVNNQVLLEDIQGSVAPNHTALLVCSALNGSTIIAGNRQTVSGNFTAQPMTLRAPDEQPPANSQYNIPAKYDRVKCDLLQDDGQTAVPAFSNDYLIKVIPPDPQKQQD